MKPINGAVTIPSDSRWPPPHVDTSRQRRATRALGTAARLVLGVAIIGAMLAITPSVGGAAVARPVETQASLTVAVSALDTAVGTFATTQSVVVRVDANGGTIINRAAVTFGSLEIGLKRAAFTVELVPASDILVTVDPATGAGAAGGQFTMLWHEYDSDAGTCSVGPFTVKATTSPFGASPYSPSSGAATMLDAAPAIPAATGCSHAATVNAALSLPIQPPPLPALLPPNTIPEPAITVVVSFTPPIQVPAPVSTTTTPTTRGTAAPHVAAQAAPPATGAGSAPPAASAAQSSAAAHRRTADRNARRSKATSTTTAPTPVDNSLNGVRDVVPFPDVGPGGAALANTPRGRNSAIDPLPVSAQDYSIALVFAALLLAAVAFALGLIGRDVRRLIPARSRHTFGGPIAPRPLPPGPNNPGDVRRPS